MADASFAVTNFTGGELCQYVQGNFNEPVYKTGLNLCSNAIPVEEGAWVRRPGTQFAGFTRRGLQGRVIGFDVFAGTPYDIELTANWMRIWQGQQLSLAEATVAVTSISTANPAVLVPGSARTWNSGDTVQLFIVPDTNYKLAAYVENRQFVVTKIDTTHFSLADQLGNTLDGSQFALGSSTVTVAKVLEIATPWPDVNSIGTVRIAQSEGQILMFGFQTVTQLLTVNTGVTPSFTLAAAPFVDGPYLDPPKDGSSVQASDTSGSVTLTFSTSQGFTSANVGQFVRLLSEPPLWVAGTSYVPGNKTKYNGVYYNCIVATGTTNPPDTTPASQAICPSAAQWAYAKITAVASGTSVTATLFFIPQPPAPNIVVTLTGPLLYTHDSSNPITTYRMGLYWGTTWPRCGTFHEGRFWFAGALSNRADSAMANNGLICSPTFYDGTPADNCGVSAVFNFPEIMQVNSMIPNHIGIVCLCRSGEVLIQSSQISDPITPTSIQAHLTTRYGSENSDPLQVGYSTLYVMRYGKKVLDLAPNFFNSQRISAINVSLTGRHLTEPGVAEIRAQRELAPLIWARVPSNGMGAWVGMTYKREDGYGAAGPVFNGWHRHQLGGNRFPLSLATGTVPGGATDTLCLLTIPSNNAPPCHVEFLTQIFQEGQSTLCAWELDDGIVPVSAHVVSSGGAPTGVQFYGFWQGIGRTIGAYIGGLDCGDYVVQSDSSITVPFGACNGLFTAAYLTSISGTSSCNLVDITSDDSLPPPLVNPTIMSMGTSGTISGDPSIADWANRRFFQLANIGGNPFIQSYSMDTGLLLATSPQIASLSSQFAIDANGDIFALQRSGGNVVKYSGSTLAQIYSVSTTINNTAHGNIQCVSNAGVNYLFVQDGGLFYLFNSDTQAFITSGTLSSGKNSLMIAGSPGTGVGFAIDNYLATGVSSFVLWKLTTAGVVSSVATIHATDIDATWTDFGTATEWPLTTDLTDGNLLLQCSTTNTVTNKNYVVKLNATTGAVMWVVAVGGNTRSNENGPSTNTRVQYGTFAYAEGGSSPINVYLIDTIAGSLLSTATVSGVTSGAAADIASDDKTGDFFIYGNYTSGGGAPVPLGSTPASYSSLWGRIDLASSGGVGTQGRLTNATAPGVIGYRFFSQGQLLRQQTPETSGSRNGPALGKTRRNHRCAAYLVNAINGTISWGSDFTTMDLLVFDKPHESDTVLQPFTGVQRFEIEGDYDYDGMIAWQTNSAYPLAISAIEGMLQTQDV